METAPSSQSVMAKVVMTLLLTFVELIMNSFVEASFSTSSQSQFTVNFYFLPIQIVLTGLIFIMVLILMWQTFPLRYGLVGTLFKEFKYTFIVILIFIGLTAFERGIKLNLVIVQTSAFSEEKIWDDSVLYNVAYYLRFLMYPVFYGFLINFCLRIIDPSYYKPFKWLK